MPRTTLTEVTTTRAGVDPGFAAADATNEHDVDNSSTAIIIIINCTGASSCTPTFITQDQVDSEDIADKTANTCPAGEIRVYGPFPSYPYNDASDLLQFDIDNDTDIEIAAIEVGALTLA